MKMEIGKWNKLPHYSVIGNATEFYVWKNEDGKGSASKWLKGADAFKKWHRLKNYRKKDKEKFVSYLKMIHLHNTKDT